MRHINIKKRWMAALVAIMLFLPTLMTALAASYPYETTSMSNVNMRKRANTSSTILKRIKAGDTVKILGKSGSYYEVEFDGKEGYVQQRYIDGTDSSADPEPDESIRYTPLAATSYPYETVTVGYVKLRKTADRKGTTIRTLPTGTLVTVQSLSGDFVKVKHGSTTGYLYAPYVNLATISPVAGSSLTESGAVLSTEAAKYTTVKKGDSGTAVTALQQVLVELGYLDDKVDGKFGEKTEAALKILQKRNGKEQTGIADQELQLLIYEGTPKDYKGYRQYVSVVAPVTGATIKENSTGEAVITAKTRLKDLGYFNGDMSAICDDVMVLAIGDFEERNGLIRDCILTAADQSVLYGTGVINAYVVLTPAPTATPTPAPTPVGTIRPDDKGNDVKLVQQRLFELGYYTGAVTGTFDDESVKALKKFQKANGLSSDGVCGVQSRAVLFAPHPVYAVPTPAPVVVATVAPIVVTTFAPITEDNVVIIKAGSQGAEVLRLQTQLQALGYYTSRLDGVYLTDDINAVRAFQKANGLKVDGKAGFNTQSLLYSTNAVAGTEIVTTNAVLRYGSEGTEVLTLQNRLIELGYLADTADGKFGAKTRAAVVAFQRANNLTRDGVVGSSTQEALANTNTNTEDNKVPYVVLYEGAVNDAVKDMQNRLITLGYLTGKADGIFGTQTSLALIAFQKANGLTADGVLGANTTKKLNSTTVVTATGTATTPTVATAPTVSAGTVSAANVRYANWYDEVRAKARSYPNVTIYDFTTGISWQLNIFSNGAHADAEPITATDTANMNRAFGGKTTWTAKAVWVVFSDGTVYMGSTHNTPHDVSHRKENNFDGHVCVHFPRTQSQVESIGPYATSHQKAIDLGWAATRKRAGN